MFWRVSPETINMERTLLNGSVPEAMCDLVDEARLEAFDVDCDRVSCGCCAKCIIVDV